MPTESWYNQSWLSSVVGVLAMLLNTWLVVHQLRLMRRKDDFELYRAMDERMRACARLRTEAYKVAQQNYSRGSESRTLRVAARSAEHRKRLIEQLTTISRLSEQERSNMFEAIHELVNTLNDVAEALEFGTIDTRRFMAKHHIGIIRDAFVLEPMILWANIFGGRTRWGLRVLQLGRVARQYNDLNKIHRQPVALRWNSSDGVGDDFGYALPALRLMWHEALCYDLRSRLGLYPRISESLKHRQNAWIAELATDLSPPKPSAIK